LQGLHAFSAVLGHRGAYVREFSFHVAKSKVDIVELCIHFCYHVVDVLSRLSVAAAPRSICCLVEVSRLVIAISNAMIRVPRSESSLSDLVWMRPSSSLRICVNRESNKLVTSAILLGFLCLAPEASCITMSAKSISADLSQLCALFGTLLLRVRCKPPAIMRFSRLINRVP
jgi:hypothetical protein